MSFSEQSKGSASERSSRSSSRSQSRATSPRDKDQPTKTITTEKLAVELLPPGKEVNQDYLGMGLPPPGEDLRPVGYKEAFMPLDGASVMLLRRGAVLAVKPYRGNRDEAVVAATEWRQNQVALQAKIAMMKQWWSPPLEPSVLEFREYLVTVLEKERNPALKVCGVCVCVV